MNDQENPQELILPTQTVDAIVRYLTTKPFGEVAPLIGAIEKYAKVYAPPATATAAAEKTKSETQGK